MHHVPHTPRPGIVSALRPHTQTPLHPHLLIRPGRFADYLPLAHLHPSPIDRLTPHFVTRVLIAELLPAEPHAPPRAHQRPHPRPHRRRRRRLRFGRCARRSRRDRAALTSLTTTAPLTALCTQAPRATTIGAIVITRPLLNAPWRAIAWPHLFGDHLRLDRRAAAQAANAHVQRITRLVVLPEHRRQGVALALVRASLNNTYPGRAHPTNTEVQTRHDSAIRIFLRAGMRTVWNRPSAADARALHALSTLRFTPTDLAHAAITRRLDAPPDRAAALEAALRTWARASGSTRWMRDLPLNDLLFVAAERLHKPAHTLVSP